MLFLFLRSCIYIPLSRTNVGLYLPINIRSYNDYRGTRDADMFADSLSVFRNWLASFTDKGLFVCRVNQELKYINLSLWRNVNPLGAAYR